MSYRFEKMYTFRGLMWTLKAVECIYKQPWQLKNGKFFPCIKPCFHTLVWLLIIDMRRKPHTNVIEKLQPRVSIRHLLYPHSLNNPHTPNRCSSDPWSGRTWKSGHSFFFHLTRACRSLHRLAPQNVSFTQTCQIRPFAHSFGFVSHAPFVLLSKRALSVNECRKTLFLNQREILGRVGPFLSGHNGSLVSTFPMSFCKQGMGVWHSVTPRLFESWKLSSQKVIFSKTTGFFYKQFSTM